MKAIPFIFWLLLSFSLHGQNAFPVKVNEQWGLIDSTGLIILSPQYDAISDFKNFNYAVVNKDGKAGLISSKGQTIVAPIYENIRILDSTLLHIRKEGAWFVSNLKGKTIIPQGFDKIKLLNSRFIAFQSNKKWGIRLRNGELFIPNLYDEIQLLKNQYFLTTNENKKGLINPKGIPVLSPAFENIQIAKPHLIFCLNEKGWAAVNETGAYLFEHQYDAYQKINDNFFKLIKKQTPVLYDVKENWTSKLGQYDNFYPFSQDKVLYKKDLKIGLLSHRGEELLPANFDEILNFKSPWYRVKNADRWTIVDTLLNPLLEDNYQYISSPTNNISFVKKQDKLGAINTEGVRVVPINFDSLRWKEKELRAYSGEQLSVFYFDEKGNPVSEQNFSNHFTIRIGGISQSQRTIIREPDYEDNNVMRFFEWFYSSANDRWGLRRLDNGANQIEPSFYDKEIYPKHNITIVNLESPTYFQLYKTKFRFENVLGIVNNERGLLVTPMDFLHIYNSDFEMGSVARCIYREGTFGLIGKKPAGKIFKNNLTYISEFKEGIARFAVGGKLIGDMQKKKESLESVEDFLFNLTDNYFRMIDYTRFDEQFRKEAYLRCKNASFGYVDTAGVTLLPPIYDYVSLMENGVGFVRSGKYWGAISMQDSNLIDLTYDAIQFLKHSDRKYIEVSRYEKKRGVIDKNGKVRVALQYDEVSTFVNGLMAVRKGRKWGYVNEQGREVIPVLYAKVNPFSKNYASVKLGRKWGLIDRNGNEILPFEYRELGNCKNGKIVRKALKGYNYIYPDGSLAIKENFYKACDFENGVARIMKDGKWGLIDESGNYIIKAKYAAIFPFGKEGLAICRKGKTNFSYELINQKGEVITTHKYQKIDAFSEGFAAVKSKYKYGFINQNGEEIGAIKYSKVGAFSDGRAVVQYEGKCGYIDTLGREVVTPQFSKCLDFSNGVAVVYNGYKNGSIINKVGEITKLTKNRKLVGFDNEMGLVKSHQKKYYFITESKLKAEGDYESAMPFQDGVAFVKKEGKWGLINRQGIELVSPRFYKVSPFENDYAEVELRAFKGIYDLNGNNIVPAEYEKVDYAGKGLFRIEKGNSIGYLNIKGEWVWELQE